jgi:hypothetical protein
VIKTRLHENSCVAERKHTVTRTTINIPFKGFMAILNNYEVLWVVK